MVDPLRPCDVSFIFGKDGEVPLRNSSMVARVHGVHGVHNVVRNVVHYVFHNVVHQGS